MEKYLVKFTPEEKLEQDRMVFQRIGENMAKKRTKDKIAFENAAEIAREAVNERQRKHRAKQKKKEIQQGIRDPVTMKLLKKVRSCDILYDIGLTNTKHHQGPASQ